MKQIILLTFLLSCGELFAAVVWHSEGTCIYGDHLSFFSFDHKVYAQGRTKLEALNNLSKACGEDFIDWDYQYLSMKKKHPISYFEIEE